ncbi:alpha/beta hydrolase [Dyella dinghuensis]|uniref:Alpha/beta hydrolase n=1 Tax=Dyella dinghuensis TaxID=1920169 RepID=A0A432LQ40_9GAMM|nr:alpha/beta hydrolase [Dyella dinghuensis]RUL62191.1 alpha/beta hydrolase [Dyella dinghuensis]
MQNAPANAAVAEDFIRTHPLSPEDAQTTKFMQDMSAGMKGKLRGIEARGPFDGIMEHVMPPEDVIFEAGAVGGISGLWVRPKHFRADEAILHLHGGWFHWGTSQAFRHLVGHIAKQANAQAFIPDYRLAPEHPFPAAVNDVEASYRGLEKEGIRSVAVTGDSAGGNLALVLSSLVATQAIAIDMKLVAASVLSPVTDLTLSGGSYATRADADPYFIVSQVTELVRSYLAGTEPNHPLASPLFNHQLANLPPLRVHVGDDEVLLDDSRRYVEQAVAAGADAKLDIWMGMPHGFPGAVGKLNAASLALKSIGGFVDEKLSASRTVV